MPFPFEVPFDELRSDLDKYVDSVFGCLESESLVSPEDNGLVGFSVFESGYETLKRTTRGFRSVTPNTVAPAVFEAPIVLIVLRCMLGFTPPQWARYATRHTGIEITQDSVRSIERNIRMKPDKALPKRGTATEHRIQGLIAAACHALEAGVGDRPAEGLHRLDKGDTKSGLVSVRSSAERGVPYSILLYERLLGRPFAGHRDSVSELIGNIVENAIKDVLTRAGISHRRTKLAETLDGICQAPDFAVPNESSPQVVIEAGSAEDDGTARDKVTRIQHLAALSMDGQPPGQPRFEVVACIAGRGFGVRRSDMKNLLLATRGRTFTLQNMGDLVSHTLLTKFRSH